MCNTTGITCGAGTAYPSEKPVCTPYINCCLIFISVELYGPLFVSMYFLFCHCIVCPCPSVDMFLTVDPMDNHIRTTRQYIKVK
jgi:hypothetical protein